jgi:hypothetical protein
LQLRLNDNEELACPRSLAQSREVAKELGHAKQEREKVSRIEK